MKPSPFVAGLGLLLFIATSASAYAITFTNDTTIGVLDTNYDGAEIVVTNCTLTVDGSHAFSNVLVTVGGTLTHTFTNSGILSLSRSFLDEAQILNGTNAVSLANTGVLVTAGVTDAGKTVTYTNGQDYAFTFPGDGSIQLQRTTNSTIPDGATVLVSYTVQISAPAGLNLTVTGNMEIAPGGTINVDGKGYGGNVGPGSGGETVLPPISGGGAGYGGYGGMSSSNAPGGNPYGSFMQPTELGSGGGYGAGGSSAVGGAGGGAVRIIAGGDAIINGILSANGANATNSRSGGGAGGSIWLSARTITGAGVITANGGAGEPIHGGGGSGGRIALQADTNNFTGSITAYGAVGAKNGGAGTIYTKLTTANGSLLIDNGSLVGATTLLQVNDGTDVSLRGNAVGVTSSAQSIGSLLLSSNSAVTTLLPNTPLLINASGDAILEPGALVTVDGKGTQGIGAGSSILEGGIYYGGGGGHGGAGGMGGNANARGGGNFDSTIVPTGFGGIGGGSGSSFSPFGGLGGGAIHLTVNGNLALNGAISADGKVGSGAYAGGGAGGSVWLTLGKFSGTGIVSANGGPGILPGGGGGGGGRIAITATSNTFSGVITARGGMGTNWGGAGTIYLSTYSQGVAQVLIDNGGNAGTNTTFDSTSVVDVIASGGGIAQMPGTSWSVHAILIHSNGTLTALNSTSPRNISVNANITIDAGGALTLDGKGNSAGQGTGRGYGTSGASGSGGGGHGGYGGANPPFGGWGEAFGSITFPTAAGSGGGSGSGSTFPPLGGAGGGALMLSVSGTLTVNGTLSANGKDGDVNSGGGSGGSLNIQCGPLLGLGIISANGGAGTGNAGGGAGGRILIAFGSNGFSGTLAASGGSGIVPGGAGTIYTRSKTASTGTLLVSNGGPSGTNTPFSNTYSPPPSPFNLIVSDGARLVSVSPMPLLSNLTVTANGMLTTSTNQTSLVIPVIKNVNIMAGGAVSVNGEGFARAAGPGAGGSLSNQGSGGGYGGVGGASASGAPGGTNYGSATQPVDRGSGGGAGANTYFGGSEGGGAIRLIAGGTLNVDGSLSADGDPGLQDDSGGGAGGSIWVTAGAVSGSGFISADGGNGELFGGGGGGGGRVAIQSPSNTFAGTITALGGFGANVGSDGSVFLSAQLPTIQGTVTDTNGLPVAGVLMQTSDGIGSTTTAADGKYAISRVPYASFSVTPVMSGFMFIPGSRSYTSSLTNVTNADYLMVTSITPTITSSLQDTNLVIDWFGMPGVMYRLFSSTNLIDWFVYGVPIIGSNVVVEIPVPVNSDPARFFRLRASN